MRALAFSTHQWNAYVQRKNAIHSARHCSVRMSLACSRGNVAGGVVGELRAAGELLNGSEKLKIIQSGQRAMWIGAKRILTRHWNEIVLYVLA